MVLSKNIILPIVTLCISSMSVAGEMPFTFEDRDRLTRIEARLERSKVKQIESQIEGVNKDVVNTIIKVLKEFAMLDVKMGDILKKFHL